MNNLIGYINHAYGVMVTINIVNAYVEDYPYMDGYGVAVYVPEFHYKRSGISVGLLPKEMNGGAIIR